MKYALNYRHFNKEKLHNEDIFLLTVDFDGEIHIGDTISYGDKYVVVDKEVDLACNCYDLYLEIKK